VSIIVNGASYRCIWWTKHFEDTEENARTDIVQSRPADYSSDICIRAHVLFRSRSIACSSSD
jgi:hypothetical protein